jgi:hypothetical protein
VLRREVHVGQDVVFAVGYDAVREFAQAGEQLFEDIFVAGMRGKLDSLTDSWRGFTDSIYRMFASAVAKMAMQWVVAFAAFVRWIANPVFSRAPALQYARKCSGRRRRQPARCLKEETGQMCI